MKVVAFNGSPRPEGNTAQMIRLVFNELEAEGIDTELVQLGGNLIQGCTACQTCKQLKNLRCSIEDDMINDCIELMLGADGIIIGSPTYVSDLTTETKALIDRATYVLRANGHPLTRKVGAAVSAVRRAGSLHTLDSINHFFSVNGMLIVGSSYWNLCIGREPGEIHDDAEGVHCMQELGRNMAWAIKRLTS
jgi:multimeric flavodoxin WrbA